MKTQLFSETALAFIKQQRQAKSFRHIKHLIKCASEHYAECGKTEEDEFLTFFDNHKNYSVKFVADCLLEAVEHLAT